MTLEEKLEEILEDEYVKYYKHILEQMKKQGFSKVEIYTAKMMYEKRDDFFDDFVDMMKKRYKFETTSKKLVKVK